MSEVHVGISFSDEHRKNLSIARKNVRMSPEHCANISKALKGHIVTQATCDKISKAHIGFTHSLESRKEMSKTRKGVPLSRPRTPEHTAKIIASRTANRLARLTAAQAGTA